MRRAGALQSSGLAIIKNQLLCEPLTPRLHLFCSNSQDHMLHLARVLQALHNALPRHATLRVSIAASATSAAGLASQPFAQEDSVQWPYLIHQHYPGAKVSQPWGLRRPVYIVQTQEEEHLVVKFMQQCEGVEVQQAWQQAGAAPEVVSEAIPLTRVASGHPHYSSTLHHQPAVVVPLCS